jgi:hypothetical protein
VTATYTPAIPSPKPDQKLGNRKRVVRDITLSGTYTTGGDPLLPSVFGLKVIDELNVHCGSATDGTVQYPCSYIYSSNKLKLWESGGAAGTAAAEKGSGESLTGIVFRATAIGF